MGRSSLFFLPHVLSKFAWSLAKIRTNVEKCTQKIMKILRTASLGSKFTGF